MEHDNKDVQHHEQPPKHNTGDIHDTQHLNTTQHIPPPQQPPQKDTGNDQPDIPSLSPNFKFEVVSGFDSQQGPRLTMEDTHVVLDDLNTVNEELDKATPRSFYAVYDGHGGKSTAVTAETVLHTYIVKNPKFKNSSTIEESITEAFKQTDQKILSDGSFVRDGSTAVITVIVGHTLYLGNCGDSECVIAQKNGETYDAVLLSEKHSPDEPRERTRIEGAGGRVILGRVMGSLAVARALGDSEYKAPNNRAQQDYVISTPYTVKKELTPANEFMVLACDGLWDKLTYNDAIQFIAKAKKENKNPTETAAEIVNLALKKGIHGQCNNHYCVFQMDTNLTIAITIFTYILVIWILLLGLKKTVFWVYLTLQINKLFFILGYNHFTISVL